MATNNQKTPLERRLEDIKKLTREKQEIEEKLLILTGLAAPTDATPHNFEYKEAILGIFRENTDRTYNVKALQRVIAAKYGFQPDRNLIARRVAYLADLTKDLERVEGKRGFYRLKPQVVTTIESSQTENATAG